MVVLIYKAWQIKHASYRFFMGKLKPEVVLVRFKNSIKTALVCS